MNTIKLMATLALIACLIEGILIYNLGNSLEALEQGDTGGLLKTIGIGMIDLDSRVGGLASDLRELEYRLDNIESEVEDIL